MVALGLVLCVIGTAPAQQPWPLWSAYTKRFLDDQGRVIDRSSHDRTTSEGQAYSMFFALVDNDRPRFEKLLNWTEANLAHGDMTLHLPAWSWGKNGAGEWRALDDNSAADADVWMAYTLIEAGRLWKEPRFATLGRLMARQIAKVEVVEVPGVGMTLIPGPNGFHPDDQSWIVNPSYMPPSVLVGLAKGVPDGPWKGVLASMSAVTGGPDSHNFAMDWISAGGGGVVPSKPPSQLTTGKQEPNASGSYDAIRVYLWIGLADPRTPEIAALLRRTAGMSGYLRAATAPPLEVDRQGRVMQADAPVGFSAAVVPYLVAAGMKLQAKAQQERLVAMKRAEDGLYGRTTEYYDQNLALFSTGWSEQRYRFGPDGRLRVKWK